jgi:hypothetical protein
MAVRDSSSGTQVFNSLHRVHNFAAVRHATLIAFSGFLEKKEFARTMTPYRFVTAAFALALMAAFPGSRKALATPAAPEPAAFGQERWEMPPGEFNEIQRRGFHDGIEGARRDYGNHRNPDVDNREEYRHPDLPR